MSKFTHTLCLKCWNEKYPNRSPCQAVGLPSGICCFCKNRTADGIYVRAEPSSFPCKGDH